VFTAIGSCLTVDYIRRWKRPWLDAKGCDNLPHAAAENR